MRTWLYELLSQSEALALKLDATSTEMLDRVFPRESQATSNTRAPFVMYGLGNATNEALAEADDHEAYRQFFQIWVHDRAGDYGLIDEIIEVIKGLFKTASDPASKVTMVRWLETSGEFGNETYNTIFRYIRFQAIISKGGPI